MPEAKEEKNPSKKKSLLRFLFAGCTLYGGYKLLEGILVDLLYLFIQENGSMMPSKAVSISVIGGADGPTAIFVTTPVWSYYLIPAILLLLGVWGYVRLSRGKKDDL